MWRSASPDVGATRRTAALQAPICPARNVLENPRGWRQIRRTGRRPSEPVPIAVPLARTQPAQLERLRCPCAHTSTDPSGVFLTHPSSPYFPSDAQHGVPISDALNSAGDLGSDRLLVIHAHHRCSSASYIQGSKRRRPSEPRCSSHNAPRRSAASARDIVAA